MSDLKNTTVQASKIEPILTDLEQHNANFRRIDLLDLKDVESKFKLYTPHFCKVDINQAQSEEGYKVSLQDSKISLMFDSINIKLRQILLSNYTLLKLKLKVNEDKEYCHSFRIEMNNPKADKFDNYIKLAKFPDPFPKYYEYQGKYKIDTSLPHFDLDVVAIMIKQARNTRKKYISEIKRDLESNLNIFHDIK